MCVWGGGGESNPLYQCGVGWGHGPYQDLLEWASLHYGGAVEPVVGHSPQGEGKIEGRWT